MTRIFAYRTFRFLLLASFASELGSWIQLAGSDWFVTAQTLDPFTVSLLGAAMMLPTFLFGIPSGVLADILGRRNVLLFAQVWMLGTSVAMTLLLKTGRLTPPALIVLTFCLYSGISIQEPALHATFPELVPRDLLPTAVSLHGAEWAGAKAIGPIIGGIMIQRWGIPSAFIANVVSYLGLIVFLWYWKLDWEARSTFSQFRESITTGATYLGASRSVQRLLILSGTITFSTMAPIILTPLVARTTLHVDSGGFGMLMSCLGVGSLLATLLAAGLIRVLNATKVAVTGLLLAALSIGLQSVVRTPVPFGAILVLGTFGGMLATMAVVVSMQRCLPGHLRGRFMGLYLVVFAGGSTLGAILTGWTARQTSIPATQQLSSLLLLVLAVATVAVGLPEDSPATNPQLSAEAL